MNNKIKVAFFGTSDRTEPIVKSLHDNFDLKLCVTKRDTHVGRSQEVRETGVKKLAKYYNIDYIEIDNLNPSSVENIIEQLSYSGIDYGVVTDFSYIIPKAVIEFFDNKLINIHFSLLPKYRGASPVQFAILNGDKKTGITFQLVDNELDKGDVLEQIEYIIADDATSGEVYDDLFNIAAEELPKVLNNYANGMIKPKPQNESKATYSWSATQPNRTTIHKNDAKIDWENTKDLKDIYNKIRAFNPWPIAWTSLRDMENAEQLCIKMKEHVNRNLNIKIYSAEIENNKIKPIELQVEGKQRMNWNDFKNGYLIAS